MSAPQARQLSLLDTTEKVLKVGSGVCALAFAALLAVHAGLTEAPKVNTQIYLPVTADVESNGAVNETETDGNGYILVIESTPSGAAVKVDGESKGATPSSLNLECTAGMPVKLELSKPGYQTLNRTMLCKDGKMVVVRATLDPDK